MLGGERGELGGATRGLSCLVMAQNPWRKDKGLGADPEVEVWDHGGVGRCVSRLTRGKTDWRCLRRMEILEVKRARVMVGWVGHPRLLSFDTEVPFCEKLRARLDHV